LLKYIKILLGWFFLLVLPYKHILKKWKIYYFIVLCFWATHHDSSSTTSSIKRTVKVQTRTSRCFYFSNTYLTGSGILHYQMEKVGLVKHESWTIQSYDNLYWISHSGNKWCFPWIRQAFNLDILLQDESQQLRSRNYWF
jgi:hypothetical protein